MNENLRKVLFDRVQKAATGIDNGTLWIESGCWHLRVPQAKSSEVCEAIGLPLEATIEPCPKDDSKIIFVWKSHADHIFSSVGKLSRHFDKYEMRVQQLQAARLFEIGVLMGEPVLIEAGTGTGKSFIPLAVCASMGKKVVVATSNKALQMQYWNEDAPFICELFSTPEKKLTYAMSIGKRNYICNKKMETGSPAPNLKKWYATATTGNTEEIELQVSGLHEYTVGDDCMGKRCDYYADCHYYKAKEAKAKANIVITNHMIACLDQLIPMAELLPRADVMVFDECHQLSQYARNALGHTITQKQIDKAVNKMQSLGGHVDIEPAISSFLMDIASYKIEKDDREIGINVTDELANGLHLSEMLKEAATELWDDQDIPAGEEEVQLQRAANGLRKLAGQIEDVSNPTPNLFTRWIRNREEVTIAPYDVSNFIGRFAGFDSVQPYVRDHTRCGLCQHLHTSSTVHVLHDNAYCVDCIPRADVMEEAETMRTSEWLMLDHSKAPIITKDKKAVLFMSATMATPTMAHFKKQCGIKHALELIVDSPFDYKKNVQLYIPNGQTPAPNTKEYRDWLSNELLNLVLASKGGALLLFTAYSEMNHQEKQLHTILTQRGYSIFQQGNMPKTALIEKFKNAEKAVLFATKSFWEGVNIPGDDLRLVVMNKTPFPALSPMFQARSAAVERAGGKSFFDLSLPEATLDIKQGAGRLVRTKTDTGVIALLDSRMHSKRYGKDIIKSLPPAKLITDIDAVTAFYGA